MNGENVSNEPVKAKAYLIDPGPMKVLWMNGSASKGLKAAEGIQIENIGIEAAIPMAKFMGLSEAISEVYRTGVPQHIRSSMISSRKGNISTVVSIYRMPDDRILILMDVEWKGRRRGDLDIPSGYSKG